MRNVGPDQNKIAVLISGNMLADMPDAFLCLDINQLDLRMGDKVRTTVELIGVPSGTEGKIILANGFNWQRYRVLFANGVEMGDLDGRSIEPIGRTARRLARVAKAKARG